MRFHGFVQKKKLKFLSFIYIKRDIFSPVSAPEYITQCFAGFHDR